MWHNIEGGTFHSFWRTTAQNKVDVLTRGERTLLGRTAAFSLMH